MKPVIFLLIVLFLNSCVITNTPGFYNGYKKLTDAEKQKVVFLDTGSSLNKLVNTGQIVAINGKQLREYAAGIDTLVVYRWSPNCSSESCILISSCQEYCTSRNYKLVVVAEYYDITKMEAQNVGELPIFIPNHIYYKKYYANKLNSLFFNDLLNGNKLTNDEQYCRFLFLSNGKLIDSKNDLFDK